MASLAAKLEDEQSLVAKLQKQIKELQVRPKHEFQIQK